MTKLMSTLISWIGHADIKGAQTPDTPGPLIRIAQAEHFQQIHLLFDQPRQAIEPLHNQLVKISGCRVELHQVSLSSPVHFGDIYQALDNLLRKLTELCCWFIGF